MPKIDAASGASIAVAVSGGADSLYSLLSLKERGLNVFALHALFLPECLRPQSYTGMLEKLKENCAGFGIPLHVADCSAAFRQKIIRPFAEAWMEGKTPNPCAHCNRHMKFGLLWEEAKKLGAELMATGHYAAMRHLDDGPALFAGKDSLKEQSYFLALTPVENLSRTLFPLAEINKRALLSFLEKRSIALPQKGESQEICFIPDADYRAFLENFAASEGVVLSGPGPVILPGGVKISTHKGLWRYTEGQRHGLGIAWNEPLYVLGKDIPENTLIVGAKSDFSDCACRCAQLNFLVQPQLWPEIVLAKTRYRQKPEPAKVRLRLENGEQTLELEFTSAKNRPPAAPGQIAAIYSATESGLRLLAGGVILS